MIKHDPDVPIGSGLRNPALSIAVSEINHQSIAIVPIVIDILNCRGKRCASSACNFFLYIRGFCDAVYPLHPGIAFQDCDFMFAFGKNGEYLIDTNR